MSYDLMVFDPAIAPEGREELLHWLEGIGEWGEDHNYDDPQVASECLRSWFLELIQEFPAMNGPYAVDDPDNSRVTDYSVGRSAIYAAFAWSQAKDAYSKVIELAKKHRVGFFDVGSSEATIWRPGSAAEYDVFYCFYGPHESVPSDRPVPMSASRIVAELLPRITSDTDFIGLSDSSGTTLQFMYHADQDHFWLEIPSPSDGGSFGTFMKHSALLRILNSLPATLSPSDYPDLEFQSW